MGIPQQQSMGAVGTGSQGFPYETVLVDSVGTDGMAVCIDSFGKHRNVDASKRRGGGIIPRVGEYWVIDRTLGFWAFSTQLTCSPTTVSGDRSDGSALASLLVALETMGFIVDNTTA